MSNGISPSTSFLLGYAESLLRNKTFLAVTGAGISTNAGLPDYRGQGQSRRLSPDLDRFLSDAGVRRDFWAQAITGWAKLECATPTRAHLALARLQLAGRCLGVVTQNVDGLHTLAGSSATVELHGNDQSVRCHDCHREMKRQEFEMLFREANPALGGLDVGEISVPKCACGGLWRPGFTMFGEEISKDAHRLAQVMLAKSEGLLILGSSLRVNSGYQLLQTAVGMSIPSILINLGSSQGVGLADVSIFVDCDLGVEQIFEKDQHD